MHGQVDEVRFLAEISTYLGFHYIALAAFNAVAAFVLWRRNRASDAERPENKIFNGVTILLFLAIACCMLAVPAASGRPDLMRFVSMPIWLRTATDFLMRPYIFFPAVVLTLWLAFLWRHFLVRPMVALIALNAALLLLGFSLTDVDFAAIVGRPDNVPIVGLLFLLGFFTWLATKRAVQNDDRLQRGLPPMETVDNEKVLVWPDLVYIELICMVALTAFLLIWSVLLQAPLEAPADLVNTPNPSKAPWYFLGLQEMLVYFDPWMAGVALPSLIIFGLLAIPYLDRNERGNGYYTITERKFAYVGFQLGFLAIWITLMVMGTFLRGPNWNFFGIYETWDAHKTQSLENIDLSQYVWIDLLERQRPIPPDDAGALHVLFYAIMRESPGLLLLGVYFLLIPFAVTILSKSARTMYNKLGVARYVVLSFLLLVMLLVPIKMICRWSFNLKYFVSIPELFFGL